LRRAADLERADAHLAAWVPDVVEQVRTEFPAVERFPAITPEYATVMGCRFTADAGPISNVIGTAKARIAAQRLVAFLASLVTAESKRALSMVYTPLTRPASPEAQYRPI
jgi:hypothetical protein